MEIGIRPDAGHTPCFLCGKQALEHRLCSSCREMVHSNKRRQWPVVSDRKLLEELERPLYLPLPYRRE